MWVLIRLCELVHCAPKEQNKNTALSRSISFYYIVLQFIIIVYRYKKYLDLIAIEEGRGGNEDSEWLLCASVNSILQSKMPIPTMINVFEQ